MYGDVGVVAETFFQLVLDGGGAVVDHGERQTAVAHHRASAEPNDDLPLMCITLKGSVRKAC